MGEPDRRRDGPINGKIGFTLAIVKQIQPLALLLFGSLMIFGFKFSTPGQEIAKFSVRLEHVERSVDALKKLECIRATEIEKRLSGLECAQ